MAKKLLSNEDYKMGELSMGYDILLNDQNKAIGNKINEVSICWKAVHDETQVKGATTLEKYLENEECSIKDKTDNKINLKTETLKSFYKRKQGKRYSSLKITEEDFFLTMKALKLDTQILEENSKIDEFPAFKYHFAKLTDEEMQKAENVFFEDAVMASQREIFGKS